MICSISLARISLPTLAYCCPSRFSRAASAGSGRGFAPLLMCGGVGQADDVAVRAERAADELAIQLLLEIIARAEPALEAMVVLAAQVKNDHHCLLSGFPGRLHVGPGSHGSRSSLIQQQSCHIRRPYDTALQRFTIGDLVGEIGFEPTWVSPRHFKCLVYTNSTTRPPLSPQGSGSRPDATIEEQ